MSDHWTRNLVLSGLSQPSLIKSLDSHNRHDGTGLRQGERYYSEGLIARTNTSFEQRKTNYNLSPLAKHKTNNSTDYTISTCMNKGRLHANMDESTAHGSHGSVRASREHARVPEPRMHRW